MSRDDFVAAAIRFVDEHGSAALTLRALGTTLGITHTAIYRHFRDKDALVVAMKDALVTEVAHRDGIRATTPRDRLIDQLSALWDAFQRHPHVVATLTTVTAPAPHAHHLAALVIADLEELGLEGDDLVCCFQMLESYVVGTQAFDLGGAPHHLEVRRQRHRSLGHAAFEPFTRTCAGVAANNEAAFRLGLELLVDGCVTRGAHNATTASR
jgi:AcrR family transcriptional regulator